MRNMLTLICGLGLYATTQAQSPPAADSLSSLSDSTSPVLLDQVEVRSKKPPIQLLANKTIVNVDAGITNAGATLLEVLEKSPGVTIDRNGNISLKGRPGVLVMIDGKPANMAGTDLNNLLSGMAASQVELIELIDNPSARYDASGNSGIINIKTKKNKQKGFNGNLSASYNQGRYSKTLNSLNLNYYTGKINLFANLTGNYIKTFSNLYAFRSYYDSDQQLLSMLEQPSLFIAAVPSQTLKTGADYHISRRTVLGVVLSETTYDRKSNGNNTAYWLDKNKNVDSTIITTSQNRYKQKNYTLNLNARHSINANSEITADFDFLKYDIYNKQQFNNSLQSGSAYVEKISGELPSDLEILTAKADYTSEIAESFKLEAGWKSSHVKTDNDARYFYTINENTVPDYARTNHFIYRENIHALYTSLEKKWNKWLLQAGIRYENTTYDANQLGNVLRKDSSFSRNYDGLFPTLTVNYDLDSVNSISFTSGRRIDRPAFHALNPFVFVINKYTYEAGNPFYRPQYTWNFEISHTFKNMLVTSLNYSRTKDYFSQIFYQDSNGIITYTGGNLDKMEIFGVNVSFQSPITRWWTVSAFANVYYKKISGYVWNNRRTGLTQAYFNLNNQFIFGKGWSAELLWVQQLHEQELQEITDPSGQVGLGIAKQIFKNKGTVKLGVRDIFYTMWMKGFTVFENSTEYFKITRDSRVGILSFTYRFGRPSKAPARRNTGSAEDEMKRVGT